MNKFINNTILKILFIFLALTTFVFGNDKNTINLQLLWKHQFQFAGYYMALEKGFYKDAGLDVNIIEYDHGTDVVKEVIENRAQFGIGRSSLLLNRSNGDDIAISAAIFQSSPNIFLALKSNIKEIKEMKNKRIMITGDSFDDAIMISMITSNGLKLDDLIQVPHTFDVNDLINGKTDLMSSYISNEPFILNKLGYEASIFSSKDYGFDFYTDMLFSSHRYLSQNPKKSENFVKASLKGWEYAFNNIEESVNIIYNKYNTQSKSKEALIYEANELKKLAYTNNNTIGHIDKQKVLKIYEYYRILGLIKNPININKFVHTFNSQYSFIEEEYLEEKKEIKYCVDPNWMPYEKIDSNGQHIGITSDYVKLFQKELNLELKLVKTNTWNESLDKIKTKECELLLAVMKTKERSKYLNFTPSYLNIPLVIASKMNEPFVDDIKDIKNKKIAMVEGYAYTEILKEKFPDIDIIEVKNIDDGLNKVIEDEVYAYVGTLASVGYKIQSEYTGELKIIAKLDDRWDLGLGVTKDDPILLNIMEKALNQISDQEKREIFNKWISVKYESSIDYTLLIYIVIFFSFIIAFFIHKQILMNKFNNQLQELLLEKTKLAQMGEMIDVIAHQWKQPLNVISIKNSELILTSRMDSKLITQEFIEEITQEISEQIELLSETTDEFRKFFRQDFTKEKVNITKLIDSTIKLNRGFILNNNLKVTFNETQKIEYELIPCEFKHIFINLISNAKDAFIDHNIKDRRIDINISKNEEEVLITVKDNAGGIPKNILNTLFEPHVTQKKKTQGTGIGLYMTKQIIEKIDGEISVSNYSENGESGAIFEIRLPYIKL